MAWIIDKDLLAEPGATPGTNANAVGKSSHGYNGQELPHRFRLLDGDNEVYYEGRSSDSSSFAPLDDFGEGNAGCTTIQYWEPGKGGGWKDL